MKGGDVVLTISGGGGEAPNWYVRTYLRNLPSILLSHSQVSLCVVSVGRRDCDLQSDIYCC